jgi:hypothetical protein
MDERSHKRAEVQAHKYEEKRGIDERVREAYELVRRHGQQVTYGR